MKLPAPFTTTAAGAGGRFVALHLPKLKQIAVFDVKEAKVVKYLPASDQGLLLAAGRDHLFVIDPGTAVLQRWSFATFEKEATVKLPDDGPFSAACTGAGAAGPLLLFSKADRFGGAKALLINPITLRPVPVKDNAALPAGAPETMGASADGQTFAWLRGAHGGSVVVTVSEGKAEAKTHEFHGHTARPGPGGRYFYTGTSVLDAQMRRVYPSEAPAAPPTSLREFFPAVHGNLFFEVEAPFGPRFDGSGSGALKIYVEGQFTPVATTQIEVPVASNRDVYLVPRERAVVVPSKGRDELIVHPFDFDALLAKSGANYLLVTSEPPGEAAAGTKFEYAPVVKSKKGGVKFKLDAGPEGAKLVDGKLVWDVPAAMVKQEVSVILTVSDASGQELFHTFRVSVVAKPAGAAVVPDPPKPPPAAPGPKEPAVAPAPGPRPPGTAAGPTAFPITAPQFEANLKTVKLPERFGAYCLAGGGRFVVFALPAAKQVAVFDVSAARVVKYLPLAEADALIAGTARHVFVLNPTANVIQRWDLATFEKEATLANPVTGTVARLLAPSAADGPVFVLTKPDGAFGNKLTPLDPVKLLPLKGVEPARFNQPAGIRVSASGTSVAAFRKDTNAGSQAFSFDGKKFTGVPIWWGNVYGHVCPSPDGNTLYTSAGVAVGGKLTGSAYTIPAAEGNGFYLSVEVADAPHGSDTVPSKLKLHLVGDEKPLADLDRVDLPRGVNVWDRQAITPDERVLFIESARVVLVLPHGEREVEVYKLDPWAPLVKSGRDYLLVTSPPPALAVRGTVFEYAPAVRSKRAGTKLKVDIGPDGMTVANGVVSWAVPKDFAEPSVTVALSVTDDAQKTVFQTFELKVVAAADVPRPLPPAPAGPVAGEPAEPAPIVVPRPAGFRPAWVKDTAEISLPVAATDMVYGGGGRFLLVTLEGGRGLAVVDLNTAKVVKTIPLPVGAHVTAGARVVVIYSPADKKIEVWGLEKLELLKREDAPADLTKFPLTSFVMGSGADGPVFFHQRTPKRTAYIDLESLKIRDVPVRMFGWGPTTLEVSADGSLLVAAGGGWAGILVSQIRDGRALKTKEDANHDFWAVTALGTPLPTADGRLLLSAGGVIDPGLTSKVGGAVPGYVVPTADAGFYLRIAPKGGAEPKGPNGPLAAAELTLYSAGHHKLFTLSDFKEFENTYTVPTSGGTVMDDRVPSHLAVNRFLYHPRAGALCTVAGDNRTVVLRKIDLATELKNAGRDHLVVTSVPPAAVAGKRFTYTPTVLSSRGEHQVRLDAGPTGMRVEKGTVIWDAPAGAEEAEVKLTVTDASGFSLPHAFRVLASGPGR
ncbi:hypothetical protein VT84_00285 [Gemmata sp. SH-PL17]|nr:hypothetical protein VT84_00285 [Gemmata sp. SH-PL17]